MICHENAEQNILRSCSNFFYYWALSIPLYLCQFWRTTKICQNLHPMMNHQITLNLYPC